MLSDLERDILTRLARAPKRVTRVQLVPTRQLAVMRAYTLALRDLVHRGLVDVTDDGYGLTPAGRRARYGL